MEKWIQIEQFLNKIITKIKNSFVQFSFKLTPQKLIKLTNKFSHFIKNKNDSIKTWTISAYKHLPENLSKLNKKVNGYMLDFQNFVRIKQKQFKKVSLNPFKINYRKFASNLKVLLTPLTNKILGLWSRLTPKALAVIIILTATSILTFINLSFNIKKINDKSQEIVKVEPEVKMIRPKYFKREEKQMMLRNIIIPLNVQTKNDGIKRVDLDLTLISSNKYIKEFFFQNPFYIHDRLNSTIVPIWGKFAIEEEGKTLLKNKIKLEINLLIKDLKIKGSIKEIYINAIIAGH